MTDEELAERIERTRARIAMRSQLGKASPLSDEEIKWEREYQQQQEKFRREREINERRITICGIILFILFVCAWWLSQ